MTASSRPRRAAVLAVLLVLAACGKRGDPLPPLRPIPAPAENVSVQQVGDRIRLQWTAPVRNTDGTTEKIELREARVLRRVVDLEALVRGQTVAVEPETEVAEIVEAEAEIAPQPEAETESETGAEPDAEAPEEQEPEEETLDLDEEEAPEPSAPERPVLQIPPFGGEVVATFDSEALGEVLTYEEDVEPSWIGKRLQYAVVYANRGNRESPLSGVAQLDPSVELEPPTSLQAEAGDGHVLVRFRPPEPENEALGYAVFRRSAAAPEYPETPLGGAPVREPRFEDRSVLFGSPVCYRVKSLLLPPLQEEPLSELEAIEEELEPEPELEEEPELLVPVVPPIPGGPNIESHGSEEICLTPEDRFPPPPPFDLVAVPAPDGVLLTWRAVDAPDLAGYRVYRSDRRDGGFQLLGEVRAGSYTDEETEPGRTYFYAVTAIDDSPRVNESDRTNVVEARRLSPP